MKVCVIVEGAYPYLTGGVSSWLQKMMLEYDDIEFIVQTIIVDRKQKNQIRYEIPKTVSRMHVTYLFDDDYLKKKKKVKLTNNEYNAFKSLFYGENIDWQAIFKFFRKEYVSLDELLKSKDFLELTKEYYLDHYSNVVFTDFLWSMRSMYQPLFTVLRNPPIKADLYHTLSTGYAGVLGSMAKFQYKKPLLLSEHGIYTREREEELIKASWVKGIYKDLWINQFYKLSSCGYDFADKVTSLFPEARDIQVELGCSRQKINVIGNGVKLELFEDLPQKDISDEYINIGAVLRVTPIKDVKTMISSFYLAKQSQSKLKLWIIGPLDENKEYADECMELIEELNVKDIIFTGTVNVRDYIGKMDFMILSSLSEGQPLVILEGFAAKKPFVSTNVGDCKNLIVGNNDDFGDAGIVVPLMNTEKMSKAILKIANDKELRENMGMNGYKRVNKFHKDSDIYRKYRELYFNLIGKEDKLSEEAL